MSTFCLEATYTPEEFLALPDGAKGFELVGGRLVEKKTGSYHSWVAAHFCYLLSHSSRSPRIGWVFDSECGYQCFPDDPYKVRKPDTSFVRYGRFTDERVPDGHVLIAPDLAVEVVSPHDTAYEVENKIQEYLGAGVSLGVGGVSSEPCDPRFQCGRDRAAARGAG